MNRLHPPWIKESEHYEKVDDKIRCLICERKCVLREGWIGVCWNHKNIDGKLYNIAYGLLSAVESRPIEIKPLFHYWPNSTALTFSGWGCNFRCPWCQNHSLSQVKPDPNRSIILSPKKLVIEALRRGDEGLCASFNEPTIHFEYILDVAENARKYGLYSMIVTNGYMTLYSLKKLIEAGVNGFSIDIKGCPETYKRFLGADPEIVFRNAKYAIDNNCHVEMVFLVVTGANDWRECIEWVIDNHLKYLGEDTPLHINKYYPAYKYWKPATEDKKLFEAYNYARKEGIKYVYIGNIADERYQDTYCPRCGKLLIKRRGYRVIEWNLDKDNRCPRCNEKIPIKGKYIPGKHIVFI
ncbi:MAG: AmmeMemoRadiSam system radical SAM enzyme [Thermoprotei archaeon]|nr:MAG: AmmeMemoRadiSam system radical SAM enzyme [Thermoprotei archaeon]